jgi:hypothetical protein
VIFCSDLLPSYGVCFGLIEPTQIEFLGLIREKSGLLSTPITLFVFRFDVAIPLGSLAQPPEMDITQLCIVWRLLFHAVLAYQC